MCLFILFFRVRGMPECVASLPPLAYNCALYSLMPSCATGWSHEACGIFYKLALEDKGPYFMYTVETKSELLEVDVVWNNDIHPLSIRDAMFYLGYGTSEIYTNPELVSIGWESCLIYF